MKFKDEYCHYERAADATMEAIRCVAHQGADVQEICMRYREWLKPLVNTNKLSTRVHLCSIAGLVVKVLYRGRNETWPELHDEKIKWMAGFDNDTDLLGIGVEDRLEFIASSVLGAFQIYLRRIDAKESAAAEALCNCFRDFSFPRDQIEFD